jgi:hypothetical protein
MKTPKDPPILRSCIRLAAGLTAPVAITTLLVAKSLRGPDAAPVSAGLFVALALVIWSCSMFAGLAFVAATRLTRPIQKGGSGKPGLADEWIDGPGVKP